MTRCADRAELDADEEGARQLAVKGVCLKGTTRSRIIQQTTITLGSLRG